MKNIFSKRAGAVVGSALLATTALAATAAPAHAAPQKYDLAVSYQASALKVPGAAGLVAIKLKNVGSERYFGEYPLTTFVVSVETVTGPKGVDRVINPASFNGAHIRDLGFDQASSTRRFEVSLANPVNKGEEVLVANLSFNDGLTREGRLVQRLVTTQTGRIDGDVANANDQAVSSVGATRSDLGVAKVSGLF